jgi:hypothetical protein
MGESMPQRHWLSRPSARATFTTALVGVRELCRLLELEAKFAGRVEAARVEVSIEIAPDRLAKVSLTDANRLVRERLDLPIFRDLTEALLSRFSWRSPEGPPKPPEWVAQWAQSYLIWRVRNSHAEDGGCSEDDGE